MAFPLPTLLPTIEELLQEVQWLDGLILITDSQRATFVSFSQVDPLLRRLRKRPQGQEGPKAISWIFGKSGFSTFFPVLAESAKT